MSIDFRSLANRDVAILMLDGAIRPYVDIVEYLAFELARLGARVRILGCSGGLTSCISLGASYQGARLSADMAQKICGDCQRAQGVIAGTQRISQGWTPSDEGDRFIAGVAGRLQGEGRLETVLGIAFHDLDLCRLAFFDFSASRKIHSSAVLSVDQIEDYVAHVADLVKLTLSLEQIAQQRRFDALLYLNGNYSQNQLASQVFARAGVACYSIEPQPTSAALFNAVTLVPSRLAVSVTAWGDEAPVSMSRDYKRVLSHFRARVLGKEFNAYTNLDGSAANAPWMDDLRRFQGRYSKIRTFFLSSEDELHAHEITYALPTSKSGKNQIDAVREFIERADSCPDIGFIVRLHPRMAANKRNKFESAEHVAYKELLGRIALPPNVHVLLGDCPVSSYFLAHISQLSVVSWSTMGLEALLLGHPAVALFPERLMYPIGRFNRQDAELDKVLDAVFDPAASVTIDDGALLDWVTATYQSQFVSVPVPRGGSSALPARVAARLYRGSRKVLPFSLWCGGHRLADAIDSWTDSVPDQSRKAALFERYRAETRTLLSAYASRLGAGQP